MKVREDVKSHRLHGYCQSSDEGKKCISCVHFEPEMDACRDTGLIAAIYRTTHSITEDTRKYKPMNKEFVVINSNPRM